MISPLHGADPAIPYRDTIEPIKTSTGARLRPNGTVHEISAQGNRIPLGAVASDAATPEEAFDAPPPSAAPQQNKSATSVVAPAAASTQSLLSNLAPVFSQVMDGYPNELVVTVDRAGYYYTFFYANSYLGYVNPNNGDLLYCGNFAPVGQEVSLDVIDCAVNGNISNLSSNTTYPSSGQRVRDGSTYYYPDGTYLKYGNEWYYDNEQRLRSSGGYEVWYRDGGLARTSSTLYYPNGSVLYQYGSLRYQSNNSRYFTYGSNVYFLDGNAIVTSQTGDRNYYWPGASRNVLARYEQNDTKAKIYYSGFGSRPAKLEDTPYSGKIYFENGNPAPDYVTDNETLWNEGIVFFDAEATKDIIAYVMPDAFDTTHVVYLARVAPPKPTRPASISVTALSATKATVNWSSTGATGYLYKIAAGSGAALDCTGATDRGSLTSVSLTSLQPQTVYRVAVCAKNSVGMLSDPTTSTFTTLQLVPPPAPQDAVISDVSWGSAKLTITSGGGNTSGYFVAVAKVGTSVVCSAGTPGTGTVWNLTPLAEQTDYGVAVCARNADDQVSSSVTRSFRTLARPRPPQPQNFSVTKVLDSMVDFAWSTGGGETTGYYLAIKEGGLPASCVATGYRAIAGAQTQAYRWQNLKANTFYGALLCASSALGVGFESQPALSVTFTTTAPTNPPAPVAITGETIKALNASFAWQGGGENTVSYRVAYAMAQSGQIPACAGVGTPVTAPSILLSGLKPDTDYTLAICAVSELGRYSDPLVKPFRTLPPPPVPTDFRIDYKHDTLLRFAWNSGGVSTLRYIFAYRTGAVPPVACAAATGVKAITLDATTYEVAALKPSTTISAVVCALDEFGLKSAPVPLSATTDAPTPPPAPTGLVVSEVKPTSVKLSWTSSGANTATYRVLALLGHNAAVTCKKGALEKNMFRVIKSLRADSDYTFAVCAYSTSGQYSLAATINSNTRRVPVAPTNFRMTSFHDTAVTLAWEPANGDSISYVLSAKLGLVAPKCGVGKTYRLSGLAQKVDGLTPDRDYTFAICAVNSDKQVSKIATVTQQRTSVKTAPPAPQDLALTLQKGISLGFAWANAGGNTWKYRIRIREGDHPTLECTGVGSAWATTEAYVKPSGLKPNTLYTVALCAYSQSKLYSVPVRISVTTALPPAVSDLRVSRVTGTSVTLAYKSNKDGTTGFMVSIVPVAEPLSCENGVRTTAASYTKTKLSKATDYHYAVCARAANGVLSPAQTGLVRTYSF